MFILTFTMLVELLMPILLIIKENVDSMQLNFDYCRHKFSAIEVVIAKNGEA